MNARLLVLIVVAGTAGSTFAQDALRGKRLYLDAGRQRFGGEQGCEAIVAFRPRGAPGLRAASLGIAHDWVGGATRVALIGQVVP